MITTVLNRARFCFWRCVSLSVIFCVSFFLKGQSQAKFIFQENFENTPVFGSNPLNSFANWDETCCSWSFTNSDSAFRSSSKSGRFELRKSDPSPQPNDSKRTQMEWNGFATPMGATWYAMSIMPAAWMGVDPAPEDLFDLHDRLASGAGSNWTNPFGIWNKNGRWTAHITYSTADVAATNGSQIVNKEYDLGPVVPGQWVDWVLHTNYSYADTGYVEVYKDGAKVIDYKGPCAYKGAMPDPYFKFGIYKWPWAVSSFNPASTQTLRVFYFDNFRVGGRSNTLADFNIVASPPPANTPPTANAGTDITIALPTNTANLNGSASKDADGSISKYAWAQTAGPNTATIASAGSATTAINNLVQGTYNFTLTVTDNGGATATDAVTVTVNAAPVNQAPTANAGSDISITLPTSSANLNGSASKDPDGTISKYAWTQASGPNTASFGNAAASSTGISGLVQGSYTFNLTVTDNGGKTATDAVTVIVNSAPVNQAPTANAGSDVTVQLPTSTATLSGSGADADGTISKYAWTQSAGPNAAVIANPSAANTGLSNLIQGTYTFNITVTDNGGKTATDAVTVTVNAAPVNQAPTANAGSDISITLPTSSANLNGSASKDPDGTISKYAWTQASGPNTASFGNAAASSTGISGLVQGTYTFNLTVTDNGGKTATDAVLVTVNAAPVNQAPTANAGSDVTVQLPTNSASLNGSGSKDADGTIAKYAWTQASGPNTASFGNTAAAATGVSGMVQGTYTFNLTVTDNGGKSSTDAVSVTVNAAAPPPNQAPVANAGSDFAITLPTSTGNLNGSSSSDPDGSISKYAWSQVSGPNTASFGNAAAATTSINGLVQGSYVVKLTVTDNLGLTSSDQLTITVNAAAVQVNKKPVAVPGQNKTIVLPTSTTNLNGTSSYDPDGNIVSFSWSQMSGPSSATLAAPSSASTNVTNLTTQGVYKFKLSVTDNQGAVGVDSISVQVDPAAAAPNQAPVANAGVNLTIVLPTNTITLNGSGSTDPDGSIASYAWSQLKGPNTANIGFPNSANSGVSGLTQGDYTFNLVVTDNKGMSSSDTVHVTVNPQPAAGPNQAPVANSGGSKSITLPTSTVTLNGASSYDPDGNIATYNWVQVSGPGVATIQTPAGSSTVITGLVAGVYEFELTVTDNKGLTAKDRSVVSVNAPVAPAPPVNVAPPVAVASDTIVVTLPIQNTSLDGSKSYDSAGAIAAYSWAYISGPSVAVLDNTDQAVALAKDLVAGTYVFSLTVTDNQGATATKKVTVMVMNSTTRPLVSVVTYYPNPAQSHTTMTIEGSSRGNAVLQIYDLSGAMVKGILLYIDSQTYTKDVYLGDLPRGTYLMVLKIGTQKQIVKKLQKL